MRKEAAHMLLGRGGPEVVNLLGAQQADKSAARMCFCEHFGRGPASLPRGAAGQRRGQKVVGDGTGDAGLC